MKINTNEATAQTHSRNYLVPQCPSALVTFPKTAFTLAETLITLAIIGVVAAMTIPSLVQKYQERTRITQLKKVYSVLSNAYNLAILEHGMPDTWGANITTAEKDEEGNIIVTDGSGMPVVAGILAKYMKVGKWCEVGKVCHPYKVVSLDGNTVIYTGTTPATQKSSFYLQDGTYINMGYVTDSIYKKYGDILVYLPVSGNKTLRRGEHAFYFYMTKKGILPSGYRGDPIYPFNPYCSKRQNNYGFGCTAWVLENENFDYLKCDDLDWGVKTKCD